MSELFRLKDIKYNLRQCKTLICNHVKITYYGTETISYLTPKIWQLIPDTIKNTDSFIQGTYTAIHNHTQPDTAIHNQIQLDKTSFKHTHIHPQVSKPLTWQHDIKSLLHREHIDTVLLNTSRGDRNNSITAYRGEFISNDIKIQGSRFRKRNVDPNSWSVRHTFNLRVSFSLIYYYYYHYDY